MPAFNTVLARPRARMTTCALLCGCALGSLHISSAYADIGDGNWYFFGDSSVGQGNYSAIIGTQGEDFYPYSSNNGFQRDSNGLIWAELMGRDVDIVMDPDQNSPNLNFAISGAHMTRGGDLVEYGIETGVRVQTEEFAAFINSDILNVGDDDVAFLIAGANDFLDRIDAGDEVADIVDDVAVAASENVSALSDVGIKTIILSEIQPIQYAPLVAGDEETKQAFAEIVDLANTEMFASIAAETETSDVNLVTMKYENFVSYMTSNAAALGFTEIDVACYEEDADSVCSDSFTEQNRYVFIDDLHFSEGGQRLAAQWWKSTLDAASGQAARQVARIGDVAQFELENVLRRVGPERPIIGASFSIYGEYLRGTPLLAHNDLRSLVETDYHGAVFGTEGFVSEFVFAGAAFSFTESDVDAINGGRYESGARGVHGYVGLKPDWYDLRVGVSYGWLDIDDIVRPTGVALLSASGKTEGNYWDTYVKLGGAYEFLGLEIDGDASFHASEIHVDGFDESGADGLALSYGKQTRKSRRIELDLSIKPMNWKPSGRIAIAPVADFNYRRELDDGVYTLSSQLIDNTANSANFTSDGGAPDRLSAAFGLDLEVDERWRFGARYEKTWADDVSDAEGISVKIQRAF